MAGIISIVKMSPVMVQAVGKAAVEMRKMFKNNLKNNKKHNTDERVTLDVQHESILKKFQKTEKDIPKLENKLNALKKKIDKIDKELEKHEKAFPEKLPLNLMQAKFFLTHKLKVIHLNE